MITELEVKGMTCNNCVRHLREALTGVEGVAEAEVGLERGGFAVVRHDEGVQADALIQAIQEEGYEARLKDRRD